MGQREGEKPVELWEFGPFRFAPATGELISRGRTWRMVGSAPYSASRSADTTWTSARTSGDSTDSARSTACAR